MLGWKIIKEGDYKLNLPLLSDEEEFLIVEIEKRFREISRIEEFKNKDEVKEKLKEVLIRVADESGFYIDKEQERYLVEMAVRHIYGLYFIDDLLKDEFIEEIAIIGLNKPVYVYITNEGWRKVNATITKEESLIDLINKIAKSLGRRITLQNPRLNAVLPDGSRLHASISPISKGELTIRKFREKPLSPKHIINYKTATEEMFALLSLFMQSDSSIIIGGNTASGKTTTLNALFSFTPAKDRILITEETPEINIPHEHQIRLIANEDMGIGLNDLVYDSLRMRPDRIIVGEVRNSDETKALFDVLLGGQARGVYATFHAQSAREAISRFLSFGISSQDINSIDLLLIQRRMLTYNPKTRKNIEVRKITELAVIDHSKPIPIYKYNVIKGYWKRFNLKPAYNRLSENLGLSINEIKKEIETRTNLIKQSPAPYPKFYSSIQKALYGVKI